MDSETNKPETPARTGGCLLPMVVVLAVLALFVIYQVNDYRAAVAPFEELIGRPIPASGDGMNAIRGRKAVEYLILGYPNVKDDAIEAVIDDLGRLPNLEYIVLEGSSVTDQGVENLRKQLPNVRFQR